MQGAGCVPIDKRLDRGKSSISKWLERHQPEDEGESFGMLFALYFLADGLPTREGVGANSAWKCRAL